MLLDDHTNRSSVDFVRATGMILVVCFHVAVGLASLLEGDALAQYIEAMPAGLNITWQALGSEFVFLFSGFLLSYLLLRELILKGRISLRNFYWKRASRLLPLYAIALALYSFIAKFTFGEFVLNVFFVSKLFDAETIVPVGWSLEVLVQSFILLPLMTILFMRIRAPVMLTIVLITASLGARYYALVMDPSSYQLPIHEILGGTDPTETLDDLYYHLVYRGSPFLLGFLLAYLVLHKNLAFERLFASRWVSLPVLLVSVALIIVSGFLPVHDPNSWVYTSTPDQFWLWYWTAQRFVFAIGVCLFALTLWYSRLAIMAPIRKLSQFKVWKNVATNIYSIYLFHPVFLIPAAVIGFRTINPEDITPIHWVEVVVVMAVATILTNLFGNLLTRYVEAPSQNWLRARYLD